MAGKRKEINNNKVFLRRFRALVNQDPKSLDELAKEFGASRQTVSKWLSGDSIPNIDALVKMAKLYNVSTDYLLGVSDTMSADVSVKAAMEYTGLSEAAVEWLHIGLDDFECDGVGLVDDMKKENLDAASDLIQHGAFTNMIHHLKEISMEAYLEEILTTLNDEYTECDLPEEDPNFRFAKKEDRDIVVANHIHVLTMKRPWEKDKIQEFIKGMDDDALVSDVMNAMLSAEQSNELHQFHASKAFNGYIDHLVEASKQRARERFGKQM